MILPKLPSTRAVAERLNRGGAGTTVNLSAASTSSSQPAASSSTCPPPAAPAASSVGRGDLWGTAAVLNALGLTSQVIQIEVGFFGWSFIVSCFVGFERQCQWNKNE